jgi:hypothetical protein
MLLRNKGSQEEYHVPSGVGKALVTAGLAEEVLPKIETKPPNTKWSAREGHFAGDYQFEPFIQAGCDTCGGNIRMSGPTCYKTQALSHGGACGIVKGDFAPQDVVNEFLRLREAYYKRSRNRRAPSGEISDDLYQARQATIGADLGLKSSETLAAELRQQIARQKK